MIICNFTPDKVPWMHIGQAGALEPGDIKEFDDARAKHILNKWGARGVLRYELNEDVEEKRKQSMQIYKRFWMNQISSFNQLNEARKNENKPYNFPTNDLVEHAETLGVELVAPWRTVQKTDDKQVAELKAENKELRGQVHDLKEDMAEILAIMKEIKDKPAIPKVIDTADLTKRFISLDAKRFEPWLIENATEVKDWPDSVKAKIREKYTAFYKKDCFI